MFYYCGEEISSMREPQILVNVTYKTSMLFHSSSVFSEEKKKRFSHLENGQNE